VSSSDGTLREYSCECVVARNDGTLREYSCECAVWSSDGTHWAKVKTHPHYKIWNLANVLNLVKRLTLSASSHSFKNLCTSSAIASGLKPGTWRSSKLIAQVCSQLCEKRLSASTYLSVRLQATTRLPLNELLWNFLKSVKKIRASLKSDKNNWHFTWGHFHIYDNISLYSS
jgi:hypothetical protein